MVPISFILMPISFILMSISFILMPISFDLMPYSFIMIPISFILMSISFILMSISFILMPISFIQDLFSFTHYPFSFRYDMIPLYKDTYSLRTHPFAAKHISSTHRLTLQFKGSKNKLWTYRGYLKSSLLRRAKNCHGKGLVAPCKADK